MIQRAKHGRTGRQGGLQKDLTAPKVASSSQGIDGAGGGGKRVTWGCGGESCGSHNLRELIGWLCQGLGNPTRTAFSEIVMRPERLEVGVMKALILFSRIY